MAVVQLNLLPDIKKEYLQSQRTKGTLIGICIITTIAALALALIFFLLVYVVQPGLINGAQGEVDKRTKELKGITDIDKYLTVQNQLKSLPQLHEDTVAYSRMFGFLKTLNPAAPNNIRLASLQVDQETKELAITGASDSFQAFTVFQDTLKNALVSYKIDGKDQTPTLLFDPASMIVDQQDLTRDAGKQQLSFTMRINYNDVAFSPDSTDISLNIPKIETTQSAVNAPDSTNSAPKNQ